MASEPLTVHVAFDLVREGFVAHDNDEIVDPPTFQSNDPSAGSTPTQTLDARAIASIQEEMSQIVHQSAAFPILSKSNRFKSRWKYMICILFTILIPSNLFLLLHSASTSNPYFYILSVLTVMLTLYFLYKMEYFLFFSVESFLSFNVHSVIALRNYIHFQFNRRHEHCHQDLECGLSFDSKSGLYQVIGSTVSNSDRSDNSDDEPIEIPIFYRFNELYVAPILCESYDPEQVTNSNINTFHLWSRFVSEFMTVFGKFHEINGLEDDETPNSVDTQQRINIVHQQRIHKVRELTLKGIRRMCYVFGLSVVIGVPLILNGSDREMSVIQWLLLSEGILFLIFAVFSGSCCCNLYGKLCRIKAVENGGDIHREHLVQIEGESRCFCDGQSKQWMNAIIDEIEDVVVELNGKYQDRWTFENDTGIFNGPNGEQYTGKVSICSVTR